MPNRAGDFLVCAFALFVGVVMGVSLGVVEAQTLIQKCEKDLPRNQHCELIAVPKESHQ